MPIFVALNGCGLRATLQMDVLKALPNLSNVDLWSGSSLAGLVALFMAYGGTAQTLLDTWDEDRHLYPLKKMSWWKLHVHLWRLFGQRRNGNLADWIADLFPADARLSDLKTDLWIPVFDLASNEPYFFTRSAALTNPDENFLLRDVAYATIALPGRIEPKTVGNMKPMDGMAASTAVGLNTLVYAQTLHPDTTWSGVVLGAGFYMVGHAKSLANGGILAWWNRLPPTIVKANAESTHNALKAVEEGGPFSFKYAWLNPPCPWKGIDRVPNRSAVPEFIKTSSEFQKAVGLLLKTN